VLYAADRHALDHCVVGHLSTEPGHRRLLERIGQRPLLDLGMRLGEASGATLAFACSRQRSPVTIAWQRSPRPGSAVRTEPVPPHHSPICNNAPRRRASWKAKRNAAAPRLT
jgi:hypothetical protein